MAETIWVNKNDLSDLIVNEELLPELGEGEVRLRIESFSVTANNVTYAVSGEGFGYWNFFPASEGYGVVPMWGHAIVEQSRHPEFAEGERVYGYLPMGTHLDVLPAKVTASGFSDAAPHRLPMSPIYNQYSRLAADPEHDPAQENERMIFAPLFKTGFLIENFFNRENWFGAEILVMTSASSKTSMGLAACAKLSSPQIRRIGLTSAGNVEFTQGTGLYDEVIAYDDVANLPQQTSVSVDFAGNSALLANIHTLLGDNLKYSCLVGATHVDARVGGIRDIVGPKPILFFAPDHAVAAIKEMGPKDFGMAVAESWKAFLAAAEGTLTMEERPGIMSAGQAYLSILKNEADPAIGIVIRP
jgi:hypothetical protein